MKKLWKVLLLTVVIVLNICGLTSAAVVKSTDVTTPASGCQMLGLPGKYVAECQKALNRMNEIRLEACKEGVKNPATGRALTINDYSPLKWSSDMEYIARIRAAESSITMDHVRSNGKSCFRITSKKGYMSNCEVIAWNGSGTMVTGIEQWYSEKNAWVKNTGAETGHYEAMIDPSLNYVGIGTFCSSKTRYANTTVGEFSAKTTILDQGMGTTESDVIQKLEVRDDFYNMCKGSFVSVPAETPAASTPAASTTTAKPATTTTTTVKVATVKSVTVTKPAPVKVVKTKSVKVNKKSLTLKTGAKATIKVTLKPANSTQGYTFKSSKPSVASVNAKGEVVANKAGKATITIKSGSKKTTVKIKVKK